jgi:IPT/TIG domain-containing protein
MGIAFQWRSFKMKSSHILLAVTLVLLTTAVLQTPAAAQANYPHMISVDPDTGKAGDVLVVSGENLEKARVKELYLTDGQKDWKTEVVEQTESSITFKIPADAVTGRFNLMVLTAGAEPRLIEQPVKVNVE